MKMLISALVLVTSSIVAGQRGSFAGTRPIGFPDTPNRTTTTPDPLGNRFGEGIPQRLPIEANGDWDLVDRLSKLPIDKQPFWFINWQSYEKHRKDPQTYPQRPNAFVDPIPVNINSSQGNNRLSTPTSGFIGTEPTVINRFAPTTGPSQPSNNVSSSGNFSNNAYPISNIYPSSNVFPNVNSNVYPSGNSNSNPTSNGNPISNDPITNVYPTGNLNFNVYPTGNPISNVYPTGNPISNVYPIGNPIGNPNSNVYPTGNPISNVYPIGNPTGNPNSNVYPIGNPTGNPNSNVYPIGNPTGNPNSNVYPIGNPTGNHNSNVYQTSNLNSNYRSVTKNGATYQTTQKQWESYFMASNVGTTTLNKYPAYYPRTDTYPSF